jgi:hypothetical protein
MLKTPLCGSSWIWFDFPRVTGNIASSPPEPQQATS